jgi:hypothetical protein
VIDVAAIKARAAQRLASDTLASPAKWLTPDDPISHLAALATPQTREPAELGATESRIANDEALRAVERSLLHATRMSRFAVLGYGEMPAKRMADRLAVRDDDEDDRRMCVECSYLSDRRRCLAAAAGRIPGADRRMEPVPDLLQRCPSFGLRKGLR